MSELIHGIDFAMLTTTDRDQKLHSRPLAVVASDNDHELWFYVSIGSAKAEDIRNHQRVNVAYTSREAHVYVSVSGTAEIVHDRARIRRSWRSVHRSSFPLGADDPDLALLCVKVERAELWDAPNGRVVQVVVTEEAPSPKASVDEAQQARQSVRRAWEREQSGRLLLCLEHLFLLHSGRLH